jgi:LPS sulfotransferase NodH
MTHFVVLAAPRTGSNLLCTLLNSHPEILCHHEVFNPQGIFTALTHRHQDDLLGSLAERDRDPLGFLERVWQTGKEFASVGFKWTLGQNEVVLESVLRNATVKKLVLRRRNRIKVYVSELIAQRTQQWEVYSKDDLILPRPRVSIELDELLAHMDRVERFYQHLESTLDQSNQSSLQLDYESLLNASEQVRILTKLGVADPFFSLTPDSVKQNPTDLSQLILNFDELASELGHGELRKELYDCGI